MDSRLNQGLFNAAARGDVEGVNRFIAQGANVNAVDGIGMTPLFYAARSGNIEIAKVLIERGANVDHEDENGETPLFLAAIYGRKEVVEVLIERGADVDYANIDGHTPLFLAAGFGKKEIAEVLIERGANVDHKDIYGSTPLLYAARYGNKEIVEVLIERGGNVDHENKHGETPLLLAAKRGNKETVEVLIEGGADVDYANIYGSTPLFLAALNGKIEIIEVLIERGANVDYANINGETAEMVARRYGKTQCLEILEKAGFERKVKDFVSKKELVIEQINIPVKVFIMGKAYAGKSQMLHSLLKDDKKYRDSYDDIKEVESRYVKEDYLERTLGLEVYTSKLDNSICTFYDFGGIDNFYLLHSMFADLEDSIILIVFDVSNAQQMKSQYELKQEVVNQIRFIKSRSYSDFDNKILLIGTHIDRLEESQRKQVPKICNWIRASLQKEGFNVPECVIINGKDPESQGIKNVRIRLVQMTTSIRDRLDDSKKMVPKFIFDVHTTLAIKSFNENRKVLDWRTVLDAAKSVLNSVGLKNATGEYIYNLCGLLEFYGKLLLTRVDNRPDEDYDDKDHPDMFVITDLNWVFSVFLGVLFSPSGYLKMQHISSDGFISKLDLAMAFQTFDLKLETIMRVLRHFKLVVKVKDEEDKVMIPGALANYKEPNFICRGKKFSFIMARECEQICKALNVATLPEIQVKVGERFGSVAINYFCGGLYFEQDCYVILLEALKLQTSVQVRVGVLKDDIGSRNLEECRQGAGELIDVIYREIVYGTINDKNRSGKKVQYAVSCSALLNQESEQDSEHHKLYNMDNVKNQFVKGSERMKHCNGCETQDDTRMLLTPSEIEDIERRKSSWLPLQEEKKGVELLKDVSKRVRDKLIRVLDADYRMWEKLAYQFEETRDKIPIIRAKANKYDCARELLWKLRFSRGQEKIETLEKRFAEMKRNDLVKELQDDSLKGRTLEELPEATIDSLACTMCNVRSLAFCDCIDNMYQLVEDFGLDPTYLDEYLENCKKVSPTDQVLSLLSERDPPFKVSELAEELKKMNRNDLVLLLQPQ